MSYLAKWGVMVIAVCFTTNKHTQPKILIMDPFCHFLLYWFLICLLGGRWTMRGTPGVMVIAVCFTTNKHTQPKILIMDPFCHFLLYWF